MSLHEEAPLQGTMTGGVFEKARSLLKEERSGKLELVFGKWVGEKFRVCK